jgi:hypothetical protein
MNCYQSNCGQDNPASTEYLHFQLIEPAIKQANLHHPGCDPESSHHLDSAKDSLRARLSPE